MTTLFDAQLAHSDPTAHLTDEDIENLGRELDAIREQVIASRGERDAAYIRKVIDGQRKLELASRAVLLFSLFPPAWVVGTVGLSISKIVENMEIGHNVMHGQWDWMRDNKIHSTTWEWDNASPSEMWKHSHNEVHHTYTNVRGKDHDLGYGIMRVDENQKWMPFYLAQPLWNFINACVFQYGIAAYDLQIGKYLKGRTDKDEFRRQGKRVLAKIRKHADARLRAAPAAVGPVGGDHVDREPDRQPGPQPVDALGDHVRALPRGRADLREDLDRRRDPRRVVPAPDARLGQHLRKCPHALHDWQPVLPDRAPPVPRPAQQPLPGDRAQGAGPVRALRPDLHHRFAAAQVASAWKKVFRLSLPNDFGRKAVEAIQPSLSSGRQFLPSRGGT